MNIRELAESIDVDEDTYLELLKLFYETSVADVDKIERGLKDGTARAVAEGAHSIKGAASSLGMTKISEKAKEIEMQGRQNLLEGVKEKTSRLKEKLEFVRIAMG